MASVLNLTTTVSDSSDAIFQMHVIQKESNMNVHLLIIIKLEDFPTFCKQRAAQSERCIRLLLWLDQQLYLSGFILSL